MILKDEILKLRAEGKSYRQIEKILSCSRANIHYHCSDPTEKRRKVTRTNLRRRERKQYFVNLLGGKCCKCQYSKCLSALEFHHVDSLLKERNLSQIFRMSFELSLQEIKKCILVCANCHREIHEELDLRPVG